MPTAMDGERFDRGGSERRLMPVLPTAYQAVAHRITMVKERGRAICSAKLAYAIKRKEETPVHNLLEKVPIGRVTTPNGHFPGSDIGCISFHRDGSGR